MSGRFIRLKEDDAIEVAKVIKDVMETYSVGSFNSYRSCGFCRRTDDYRGRLTHSDMCRGARILKILNDSIDDLDEEIDVIRISDLMEQDQIDPYQGMGALKWLANICNHGMEIRTTLKAIREIKAKMGIPF